MESFLDEIYNKELDLYFEEQPVDLSNLKEEFKFKKESFMKNMINREIKLQRYLIYVQNSNDVTIDILTLIKNKAMTMKESQVDQDNFFDKSKYFIQSEIE